MVLEVSNLQDHVLAMLVSDHSFQHGFMGNRASGGGQPIGQVERDGLGQDCEWDIMGLGEGGIQEGLLGTRIDQGKDRDRMTSNKQGNR